MGENKLKKKAENPKEGRKKPTNFIVRIFDFILKILNGSFMTNEWTRKQLPFILFLVLLAVINIANIISVERKQRQKTNIERELSRLRAEHSFYLGKVARSIKPSVVKEKLLKYDIKDPVEPVIKIKK